MSIYVETRIRGTMEELWEKTQTPELHERWDLRFTRITYLPRASEQEPQRFLYETRIGFGLAIAGTGETVGSKNSVNGERASALKFWSDDPKSLIREGSGFWKYVPCDDGSIRFFTEYRYDTRYGLPGRLFDRFVFEPLMGWATAWSFDRLRLWIEKGIEPAAALRRSLVYALSRLTLAFVFLYHGLLPKLLLRHPDEIALITAGGIPAPLVLPVLIALGIGEVIFGLLFLLLWRVHVVFPVAAAGMILALLPVVITAPGYLGAAFNPVTLNAAVFALAVIGWLSRADLPSAARCRRQRPKKETAS
jgi:uncharacterized membrane protein YphA (DoxX/SURF4 family)